MSQVYIPEHALFEQIERLEIEARNVRRRLGHVRIEEDRRVLNRQLTELEEHVGRLQQRLPD